MNTKKPSYNTNKKYISVVCEEPEKENGKFSILVTAIVTGNGHRALKDKVVQFFLNGIEYNDSNNSLVPTDNNGRVQITIEVDEGPKKISVSAQVVGEDVKDRKIIVLPIPEKRKKLKPFEIKVRQTNRDNKKRNIVFYVLTEDGLPVPNTKLTVIGPPESFGPKNKKGAKETKETDKNGSVSMSFKIPENTLMGKPVSFNVSTDGNVTQGFMLFKKEN